jgi:hypothetical protein
VIGGFRLSRALRASWRLFPRRVTRRWRRAAAVEDDESSADDVPLVIAADDLIAVDEEIFSLKISPPPRLYPWGRAYARGFTVCASQHFPFLFCISLCLAPTLFRCVICFVARLRTVPRDVLFRCWQCRVCAVHRRSPLALSRRIGYKRRLLRNGFAVVLWCLMCTCAAWRPFAPIVSRAAAPPRPARVLPAGRLAYPTPPRAAPPRLAMRCHAPPRLRAVVTRACPLWLEMAVPVLRNKKMMLQQTPPRLAAPRPVAAPRSVTPRLAP